MLLATSFCQRVFKRPKHLDGHGKLVGLKRVQNLLHLR